MGKNFTKDQKVICLLLLLSFLLGVISIYFNKIGGVQVGHGTAIYTAVALVPLTFLYLRKFFDVLDAVLLASIGGLGVGCGVGFFGLWIVTENSSRIPLAIKWLVIGTLCIVFFAKALKRLSPEETEKQPEVDYSSMTAIERLKHGERLLSDSQSLEVPRNMGWNPLGIVFIASGLTIVAVMFVQAENTSDRWIAVGTVAVAGAIGIPLMVILRRRTTVKLNKLADEVEELRVGLLADFRAKISELERPGEETT